MAFFLFLLKMCISIHSFKYGYCWFNFIDRTTNAKLNAKLNVSLNKSAHFLFIICVWCVFFSPIRCLFLFGEKTKWFVYFRCKMVFFRYARAFTLISPSHHHCQWVDSNTRSLSVCVCVCVLFFCCHFSMNICYLKQVHKNDRH